LKKLGLNNACIGCGAKESDPECNCEWAICSVCGCWDCWIRPDGHYHCPYCDYDSDKKTYDW